MEIVPINKPVAAAPSATPAPVPTPAPAPSPAPAANAPAAPPRQELPSAQKVAAQFMEQAQAGEQTESSPEELEEAVERINQFVQNLRRDLQFTVDKEIGRTIITVLDSQTKEIIRQIPPEEMLAIARRFAELQELPLLDTQA